MKKLFTLFAFAVLVVSAVQAQWIPSDKDYTIVGADSIYGQGGMQTAVTPQGNIVLTWYNTPSGMRYDNPAFGYYLYMQVFDKSGNAQLPKDGIVVCGKAGKTYTTDYGMSLASNGDVLLSYFDTRDDSTRLVQHVYAYRYNQSGEPVWNADGIRFDAAITHSAGGQEMAPAIVASGDNIFMGCVHTENYNVKADSTNWEPSPWIENDSMPDSVQVEYADYQLQRINDDGTMAWTSPKIFSNDNLWIYPAQDGNVFVIYENENKGLSAELIDKDGNNKWGEPVAIENDALTSGYYFEAPTVTDDGQGGLTIAYRKLTDWTGYIVLNHLDANGNVYAEPTICNGTTDGDGTNPKIATRDGRTLVIWKYSDTDNKSDMAVNQFNLDGSYAWTGDSLHGYYLGQNDMWGFTGVKVIPQADGWVLLYGENTSWNGANFYCEKIDLSGNQKWKKQIAETDFKSSGFSVVYDDNYAYIFYTCDREIGDDWQEIPGPGGMRVMVVDITDTTNGIGSVSASKANGGKAEYYKVDGTRTGNMGKPGLYIVKDANGISKRVVK